MDKESGKKRMSDTSLPALFLFEERKIRAIWDRAAQGRGLRISFGGSPVRRRGGCGM